MTNETPKKWDGYPAFGANRCAWHLLNKAGQKYPVLMWYDCRLLSWFLGPDEITDTPVGAMSRAGYSYFAATAHKSDVDELIEETKQEATRELRDSAALYYTTGSHMNPKHVQHCPGKEQDAAAKIKLQYPDVQFIRKRSWYLTDEETQELLSVGVPQPREATVFDAYRHHILRRFLK